jgi:hypothetical protein
MSRRSESVGTEDSGTAVGSKQKQCQSDVIHAYDGMPLEQPFTPPVLAKGFVGYGDADPSNVSALVHGAEIRVAETRAVNRALRKAYGIGIFGRGNRLL